LRRHGKPWNIENGIADRQSVRLHGGRGAKCDPAGENVEWVPYPLSRAMTRLDKPSKMRRIVRSVDCEAGTKRKVVVVGGRREDGVDGEVNRK
jgi:hypothetical protein